MKSVDDAIAARTAEMTELLSSLVSIPSVSGQERAMTEFVADWARRQGWEIDLWQADEEELARGRYAPLPPKFVPLAGRPTLVIRVPGRGKGRSLMFNAHADVVAAPNAGRWKFGPWTGTVADGKLHGRGACDTKGPLVSALWAMRALEDAGIYRAGDLMLELIPGEEDCVGLGTLTSVARGWRSDGMVVLEPTEGLPRCASRGGLRFEILCLGRAVHGTVKWLGKDAIGLVPAVLAALERLETQWNDRGADPLYEFCPLTRPITVDAVHGGNWQGMVCDECMVAGYFELLPGDNLEEWSQALINGMSEETGGSDQIQMRIVERYHGHSTAPSNPLCLASGERQWSGFNSGCEAGLRARLLGTPTLVWGPGSLAQAHALDEYVDLPSVAEVARRLANLSINYCGPAVATTE